MRKIFDDQAVNLFLLSCVSILVSLQVLTIVILIFQEIPLTSELTSTFFSDWASGVRPEREPLYYRFFIFLVVGLHAGLVYKFRKRLPTLEFTRPLIMFVGMEVFWTSILGSIIFKMVVEGESVVIRQVLYSLLALAGLSKLFWKLIYGCRGKSRAQTTTRPVPKVQGSVELRVGHIPHPPILSVGNKIWTRSFDVLILALIVLFVFIPDREGVIAQIFGQDMFHHLDTFAASPAWAFAKGNILNVDSCSQYGFGMPVIVAFLSKTLGSVSYENILLALIALTIVYLTLSYAFLRLWFRSVGLALLGVFFILKFQMFNNSTADPIIWRYPSTTVVRYFFDIPFFILILMHLRKFSDWFLVCAGIWCGAAVYYLTDSGIYLTATYYAYLFLLLTVPATRSAFWLKEKIPMNVVCGSLPLVSAVFLFWLFAGTNVFTVIFWDNLLNYVRLFQGGWGALPISSFVQAEKFLNFFMGMGMCAVYLMTVIFTGGMCYLKKWDRQYFLAILIALYGLAIFHYYIARSSPDSIPVVSIPCLLLFCFWLNIGKEFFNNSQWRYAVLILGIGSFIGLSTTRAFIQYPNYLNLSGKLFTAERQRMREQSPSAKDIFLIAQMTRPDERVCLISSQETVILMKADRQPFLYYFPLLIPRTFQIRDFGGTILLTRDRLQRTLKNLEHPGPRYVFIEKKFLGGLPPIYYARFEVLKILVNYLQQAYEPVQVGEYLVALRRKDI